MNPVTTIIRHATRNPAEPYNILCAPTHERYEINLAKTGHNFYAFQDKTFKFWQTKFGAIPKNYHLLAQGRMPSVKLDMVLSANKFGQFQILAPIAKKLQLPLISLEHTLPFIQWTEQDLNKLRNMRGHYNCFISDYSIGEWGWQDRQDTHVVHHGLDTGEFSPDDRQRKNHVLSVVNDWKNRDWCCGYYTWTRVIDGLPFKVVGDNPGLSLPSNGTADLVNSYRDASIFLNTSTISPVPMSLMEAMSCGCAVVSTATCMIPEIITNGVNGFISNDERVLRKYCEELLKDEELRNKLGKAARQSIIDKFGLDKFTRRWNTLFDMAANMVFTG